MLRVLLRAAPWRALLGLAAAGGVVGTIGLVVGGGIENGLLHLAYAVLGGAAATALDEPAAAVVAACPLSRGRGIAARALAVGAPVAVAVVITGVHIASRGRDRFLLVELVGCALVGFAAAAVARHWSDEPGDVVASGIGLAFVATLLIAPVAHRLALFPDGAVGGRTVLSWATLVVGAGGALAVVVPERRWRR